MITEIFYDMSKLDVSKDIGRRLGSYRKARGLTQIELAKALGISQSLLAYYETGHRNIPVATLISSARALNISVSELLGEGDVPAAKPGPKSVLEKQIQEVQKLPNVSQAEKRNFGGGRLEIDVTYKGKSDTLIDSIYESIVASEDKKISKICFDRMVHIWYPQDRFSLKIIAGK